ncbi:hypothetical protein GQ457_08G013930 [Hibiscus cannabinus]
MACPSDEQEMQQHHHCCLSHEFYRAASKNPEKIAVIHASPSKPSASGVHIDRKLINGGNPPVYEGDRCFTFADLLASVESLSFRICSVLGGADDPYLIKPQTSGDESNGKQPGSVQLSEASLNFIRGVCQHTDLEAMYIPKTVVLFMPPSVEYIVSVLSVLKCGEAFLPLDPSWPRDRILSILDSSNASLVVMCDSSFGKSGSELLDHSHWIFECNSCPILRFSMEARIEPQKSRSSLAWPCENERKRLFCYLMYTSGSTGKPKGVCGTEEGMVLLQFVYYDSFHRNPGDLAIVAKFGDGETNKCSDRFAYFEMLCTVLIGEPTILMLEKYTLESVEVRYILGLVILLTCYQVVIWFFGEKDRTIKVNGQRIALEEVEDTLRGHKGEFIIAFILLREKSVCFCGITANVRQWKGRLCQLTDSIFSVSHVQDEIRDIGTSDLMQVIKKAFCDALMVEDVSDDDDFFTIGGNSIAAAHVSHNLGISMRLLYTFSTSAKLLAFLLEKKVSNSTKFRIKDNPESLMDQTR